MGEGNSESEGTMKNKRVIVKGALKYYSELHTTAVCPRISSWGLIYFLYFLDEGVFEGRVRGGLIKLLPIVTTP